MAKGFVIGATLVGAVMVSACSYFTTDRQVALAKSVDCHNRQMVLPALKCTTDAKGDYTSTAYLTCMATAQLAADGVCGPLLGSDFIAGATAVAPSPAPSPAAVAK